MERVRAEACSPTAGFARSRSSLQFEQLVARLSKPTACVVDFPFLIFVAAAFASRAAPPLTRQSAHSNRSRRPPPTPGKDVVHQLNSAFTKVFEIVAPSVVIIEVTKKNDGSDSFALDDLFFQASPDENAPRRQSARNPTAAKRRLGIHRPAGRLHLYELPRRRRRGPRST